MVALKNNTRFLWAALVIIRFTSEEIISSIRLSKPHPGEIAIADVNYALLNQIYPIDLVSRIEYPIHQNTFLRLAVIAKR